MKTPRPSPGPASGLQSGKQPLLTQPAALGCFSMRTPQEAAQVRFSGQRNSTLQRGFTWRGWDCLQCDSWFSVWPGPAQPERQKAAWAARASHTWMWAWAPAHPGKMQIRLSQQERPLESTGRRNHIQDATSWLLGPARLPGRGQFWGRGVKAARQSADLAKGGAEQPGAGGLSGIAGSLRRKDVKRTSQGLAAGRGLKAEEGPGAEEAGALAAGESGTWLSLSLQRTQP